MYKNDGYFGNAFANARYVLNHGYAIMLNGGYASGNITLQGHNEGQGFSNYAVSKEFLKKKATLTLGAANFYQKYLNLRSKTNGADFSQVTYNQQYYRRFFLRFNYRFGKLNSEIKKNQHGINNDDLKQGD